MNKRNMTKCRKKTSYLSSTESSYVKIILFHNINVINTSKYNCILYYIILVYLYILAI